MFDPATIWVLTPIVAGAWWERVTFESQQREFGDARKAELIARHLK